MCQLKLTFVVPLLLLFALLQLSKPEHQLKTKVSHHHHYNNKFYLNTVDFTANRAFGAVGPLNKLSTDKR